MSRKIKLAIASAVTLGLIVSALFASVAAITGASVLSSQIEEVYVRSSIGSEVVKVSGERGSGSGFYLKHKGKNIIITNRHVCGIKSKEGTLKVSDKIQKQRTVYVLHESMIADICILSGDEGSHGLTVSGEAPYVGQKLYTVGHPSGQAQTVSTAIFLNTVPISIAYPVPVTIKGVPFYIMEYITRDSYQVHGYSRGGSSGSVISDIFGNVVSILYAGNTSDNMQTFGVTLPQIKEVLSEFDAR